MPESGLTLTDQAAASTIATVEIGDRTPSSVWHSIAATERFQEAIIEALRESAAGMSPVEFRDELRSRDLPATYAALGVRIAAGDKRAVWDLLADLQTLGTGRSSIEDVLAAPALLEGGSRTPTIGIRIGRQFFERRADQRREICQLIAALAQTCDVRLIATGLIQCRLATEHRTELPGVSEQCSTPREQPPTEAAVEQACDELDHDSREVAILRDLANDPAESLSYHALLAESRVSRSRISQCLSRLAELGLVATFVGAGRKYAELLGAGREYLNVLDEEIGRQRRLDECVSESGKPSIYSRVSTTREGEGGATSADRRQHGSVVDVEYMPRWRHAAVAASATNGGVSLVDHPQEPSEELRQPYLSYDGDRLLVGAEYCNPMQYWVCVARALTDRRVWEDVLTPERLDGDAGDLGGLLTDDLRILRDARCLGYLKNADANGTDYAEALMDGADELCSLLRRWHNGDFEDACEFRGVITQTALGLAGTVAHLCDLADVELVREVRLPEFTRRFDAERREGLLETLAKGIAISSRHGHFAAYRQLLETREEKRSAAMSPSIPADDPLGELIGSFVIVGDGASALEEPLRDELRTADIHEDAPEFGVSVPIRSATSRSTYATAIYQVLSWKRLSPTREAVSLLQALAGSPYDVSEALGRGLAPEDSPRDIRLDEVRVALSTLDSDRVLPTMTPTLRKTVTALLTAASPLSQSELAERAGVSTRSLRTHLPRLETMGLVTATEAGYRFALPFGPQERLAPAVVTDVTTSAVDVLYELGEELIGDRVHDPDDPIGAAFFEPNPIGTLLETAADLSGWIELATALDGLVLEDDPAPASFGPELEQTALPTPSLQEGSA